MTKIAALQRIARVVHEAVSAWSRANDQDAYPAWDAAPEWMQTSTIESVQFMLDNPGALPSAQHDQWMDQKRKDGWTYGKIKDADAKTHPMLVAYNQLPEVEKAKDRLINAIVMALSDN